MEQRSLKLYSVRNSETFRNVYEFKFVSNGMTTKPYRVRNFDICKIFW